MDAPLTPRRRRTARSRPVTRQPARGQPNPRHEAEAAPADSAPATDNLAALAEVLDLSFAGEPWGHPPHLVRVTDPVAGSAPTEFDLGLRPLREGDGGPVEALTGFVAPAAWRVIGVVCEGTAHQFDGEAAPRTARVVHLVERGGASASVVRLEGSEPTVLREPDQPPDGRLDEVCRRALGLATAPADTSPQALWALVWLDRVVAAAAPRPGRRPSPTWSEIAGLHPAASTIAASDIELASQAPEHLHEMGDALQLAWGWSALRKGCAEGRWPIDDIPPAVAAWMDDGMFARWSVGMYPPLTQLLDAVESLLPAATHARVVATLDGWRLLPTPEAA